MGAGLSRELLGVNVAFVVLGGTALAGNSFILAVVGRYRELRKADCLGLLAALAVADWLTGLGSILAGTERIRVQLAPPNEAVFKVCSWARMSSRG